MLAVLSTVLVLLAEYSVATLTLTSPCPSVFTYDMSSSVPGLWHGVINLSSNTNLYSMWVNLQFDDKVYLLGNGLGAPTTKDNMNFKIQNLNKHLEAGSTVKIPLFIQYQPQKKPPRLVAIKLNERDICNAGNPEQTTELPRDASAKPDVPSYTVNTIYDAANNGTPLDTRITAVLRILQTPTHTNPRGIHGQPLCGTVVQKEKGAVKTLWPWQIALYQHLNVSDMYICGGTLVTAQHVITAAHCVTRKSSKDVVDRHTLAVFMGTYNVQTSIKSVRIGFMKEIIVHPDYNKTSYNHNVAILQLTQPQKYNDYIRPACLWPKDDTDLKKVIGKKGMLIGWRYDDKGELINDLSEEEMPVISQAVCITSHDIFRRFTSPYTYCAGNRDGNAACISGGSGIVMKRGSTWYLRGLVSVGIPEYGKKRCNPSQYFVFTDLAKVLSWIYNNVFDF